MAGAIPVPPPPFSYESLLFSSSISTFGQRAQLGMRLVMLSELGSRANWMTSYNIGVLTTLGKNGLDQVLSEFSYVFHFRWAARFLINAGTFIQNGLQRIEGPSSFFSAIGPTLGVSVLPEGWLKIPLELTLSYRAPIRYYDSLRGFEFKPTDQWIEFNIGLAFM